MKNLLLGVFLLYSGGSLAASIAIIDSGLDTRHLDFMGKVWRNEGEIAENRQDDEHNGFVDDLHGWNFVDNNPELLDESLLGTFHDDVFRFFTIQGRVFRKTVTEEERLWVGRKMQDSEFLNSLQVFGNFIHGTHVAGIASKFNAEARILGIKMIPTGSMETRLQQILMSLIAGEEKPTRKIIKWALRVALGELSKQQATLLAGIGQYVHQQSMDVANCSFGLGMAQARAVVATLMKSLRRGQPAPDWEVEEFALYFINQALRHQEAMMRAAPNTLFVLAAGNSGTDNTLEPVAPANIKSQNAVTVAATYGRTSLAEFSNYGTPVDLAAPGVVINSAIPGDRFLELSGTSQAAPRVANIATRIKAVNARLTPKAVKFILMETVDKKDFLLGKVLSGGLVNHYRAERAAELSLQEPVEEAVKQARLQIPDLPTRAEFEAQFVPDLYYVLPLPSGF